MENPNLLDDSRSQGQRRKIPDEIQKLFRCRKTVFSMLRKRGYNIDIPEDALNLSKFVEKFGLVFGREVLEVVAKGNSRNDNIICAVCSVFFHYFALCAWWSGHMCCILNTLILLCVAYITDICGKFWILKSRCSTNSYGDSECAGPLQKLSHNYRWTVQAITSGQGCRGAGGASEKHC